MNRPGAAIQAFVGYIIDWYNLIRFEIRNPHSLFKAQAIRRVQRRTGARTFIETGTYLGVTTSRCASRFDQVYTIELDPVLAVRARTFLGKRRNIKVITGDADVEIRCLLEERDCQHILLFLDGHFSGSGTARGSVVEPAVSIIKYLANHVNKIDAIIIDDFREFGTQDGWPTKWELIEAIERHFAPYRFSIKVQYDMVFVERHNNKVSEFGKYLLCRGRSADVGGQHCESSCGSGCQMAQAE